MLGKRTKEPQSIRLQEEENYSYAEGLWIPTNLILSLVLGIVSLSFFQKIRGGGTPTTRHSSLTGVPSGIPMFCSFSKIWGGCFISFSAADASFDDHYYYSLKEKYYSFYN